MTLPDADLVAESKTGCSKVNRDYFWIWELYATDIYRRPTSTKAKSPYFFSYAFHHDGIILGTFAGDGKEPTVSRHYKSFENNDHHWDTKFHPFVQNQWVFSSMCESENVPLPSIQWSSNQFRLTTDDSGIGILCTKGHLYIGTHFFSTGTVENHEDFGFRLFFRLRKMHANQSEILQRLLDEQMGRKKPSTKSHHGDTGTSILEEPDPEQTNEITDFWDDTILGDELLHSALDRHPRNVKYSTPRTQPRSNANGQAKTAEPRNGQTEGSEQLHKHNQTLNLKDRHHLSLRLTRKWQIRINCCTPITFLVSD